MEQNSPVETFQSVREDNLFKQTVYSGKVPVGPSNYACSIYFPYGITGISMLMETNPPRHVQGIFVASPLAKMSRCDGNCCVNFRNCRS
jgi:hypothetical protein